MSTSSLSAAGSSTYSSNTMHVGDGTWDSSRDDFLLPNVQGLNYETMRYNGMGNRFASLSEYHGLIRAHGVIAAITFLGIVPAAILIARFYYRDPRLALRLHISLQILTVILSTVVLITGYFAVGPSRSLTNPHHGIGVAIYVLVLIQAIGGWLVHKIEKGKTRYFIPIKLMLHQWFGRAIALLALAQIPIGLTLYGSPLYLFILYAVAMFGLVVAYFWLTFDSHKRAAMSGDDGQGSYISGSQTELSNRQDNQGRSRTGIGALTGALAGGAGLEALRRRFSNRNRREDGRSDTGNSQGQSRFGSESYVSEKYTDDGNQPGGNWKDSFYGGVTGLGAAMGIKKYKDRQRDNDDRRYQRTEQGGQLSQSTERFQNLEEGRPLVGPNGQNGNGMQGNQGYQNQNDHWRRVEEMEAAQAAGGSRPQPQNNSQFRPFRPSFQADRHGQSNVSYESPGGYSDTSRKGFAAKFATVGGLGEYFKRRRSKKEQRRVEAQRQREHEEERMFGNRRPSQPLNVGDDVPRRETGFPPSHVSFAEPLTETEGQNRAQNPVPATTGIGINPYANQLDVPTSGMPPSLRPGQDFATAPPPPTHQDFAQQPVTAGSNPYVGPYGQPSQNQPRPYQPYSSRTNLPPSPYRGTPPRVDLQHQSQINLPQPPPIMSPGARNSPRAGSATYDPSNNQTQPGTVASPPVSVKVRVHNDHVTLRRLTEEEAAIERDRRRGQQPLQPPHQQVNPAAYSEISAYNPSPPVAGPSTTPNYRLTQPGHPVSATTSPSPAYPSAPMPPQQTIYQVPPQHHNETPQYPISPGDIGSSPAGTGTYYDTGTGTDVSNYDSNRRRRRAERARAEQARLAARMGGQTGGYGGGGPSPAQAQAPTAGGRRVDFV